MSPPLYNYRLAADKMMENIDQFWEDDDGERMRKV